MFIRKKKIKGREYYFIVKSTRLTNNKLKKFERYIGINKPTASDLKKYEGEFDQIKDFLEYNKDNLEKIKKAYLRKIKKATHDELKKFEEELTTRFTYDTNRIEGSTLSYKDTKMLLEEGITPTLKPINDIKESENHKSAFIYLKNNLKLEITRELILKLHKILKQSVTEDAGSFRDAQVRVASLIPIRHDMIEVEIKNLIIWLKKNKKMHPLELAAIFHAIFERLHPFFDGNGRIGRLLLNFILLKNKYPIIIVQNKNKRRYYTALKHADKGNYFYLIKYLYSELEKQTKEYF